MNNRQSLPGLIVTLATLCIVISGVSLYILSQPILSLIQEADKALYQAKLQGRDRVVVAH